VIQSLMISKTYTLAVGEYVFIPTLPS
jgi:hypothetical protein